jgi:hypothetical protein
MNQAAILVSSTLAPCIILLILFLTAVRDARTGTVPDRWLLLGIPVYCAGRLAEGLAAPEGFNQAFFTMIGEEILTAIFIGAVLWGANELWFRWKKQDAFGMGDVKWTMLLALYFGPLLAIAVWPLGAILALFWMGGARLIGRRLRHVHYVPFLMAALLLIVAAISFWFSRSI